MSLLLSGSLGKWPPERGREKDNHVTLTDVSPRRVKDKMDNPSTCANIPDFFKQIVLASNRHKHSFTFNGQDVQKKHKNMREKKEKKVIRIDYL